MRARAVKNYRSTGCFSHSGCQGQFGALETVQDRKLTGGVQLAARRVAVEWPENGQGGATQTKVWIRCRCCLCTSRPSLQARMQLKRCPVGTAMTSRRTGRGTTLPCLHSSALVCSRLVGLRRYSLHHQKIYRGLQDFQEERIAYQQRQHQS